MANGSEQVYCLCGYALLRTGEGKTTQYYVYRSAIAGARSEPITQCPECGVALDITTTKMTQVNKWLERLYGYVPTFDESTLLSWQTLPGGNPVQHECGQELVKTTRYQLSVSDGDMHMRYPCTVYRASVDSGLIDHCPKCGKALI